MNDTIYMVLDTIGWYQNNGDKPPTFTNNVIDANYWIPIALTVADLDSDHDLDVIAGSNSNKNLVWCESNGDSADPLFISHIIDSNINQPQFPFAADLDKDNDRKVIWYENDGTSPPGFTEHTLIESVSIISRVFAADLDGDGDLDLITWQFQLEAESEPISWFENPVPIQAVAQEYWHFYE